jgi:hypothetical protein
MEAKIKEFVKLESNYGSGSGSGAGSGASSGAGVGYGFGVGSGVGYGVGYDSGSGYGAGVGYGSGYGAGVGYGSGDGSGSGYGSGYDSGYGSGSGDVYGYGYGFGDGSGIKMFSHQQVNNIDSIPTIITSLKGNIAKGFILNSDFTLSPCFVVKHNSVFAHGETLHEAQQALERKLFDEMEVEERIEMFLKEFEPNKKYKGLVFFDWHNKLTGSCEMGRKSFIRDNNLSLDDEYTVDEFIAITENSYGSEIIKQLKANWGKG